LARCLEGWGYAVKQAGSSAEALEMMVANPASVVLCDVKMPGNDGLWLAERLRAHWPHTPIIMASAIDDDETVRKSRDLGVVDYITKPIAAEQLLEILRRATTTPNGGRGTSMDPTAGPAEVSMPQQTNSDAEYSLEYPVRCPACGERIETVKAVRLIRSHVNFTSTLPRRGRVLACPACLAVIPAELTNF
jgi:CheY-like chemotaxis protein